MAATPNASANGRVFIRKSVNYRVERDSGAWQQASFRTIGREREVTHDHDAAQGYVDTQRKVTKLTSARPSFPSLF